MKKTLNQFLKMLQDGKNKPNNMTNPTVKLFRNEVKKGFDLIIPKDSYFRTKASTGQHSKVMAEVCWYAIFDERFIDKASGNFYYVVYLFRADGKGFYLSLNQSWTNIKAMKLYDDTDQLIDSKQIATKAAQILADKVDSSYLSKCITRKIDLNANNELGIGYEYANVLAKYYEFGKFSNEQLEDDLLEMLEVYSSLVKKVNVKQYKSLISTNRSWIAESISIDNNKIVKDNQKSIVYSNIVSNYNETFDENVIKESSDSYIISDDKLKKQIEKNSSIGHYAEELALEFYKEETRKIVGEDIFSSIESKIENVGLEHGYGYDIKAFDLDDLKVGKETEIHVEVKATKNKLGTEPFFMTRNELVQAITNKGTYRILRIYDFNSEEPKFDELNLFKYIDDSDKTKTIEDMVKSFLNIIPNSYIIKGWKK